MRVVARLLALLALAVPAAYAGPPAEILIPGENLFTESLTSTADGTVIIGALGPGAIFRAPPGADTAQLWIKSGTAGMANVLGVFADDKANTLWACSVTAFPAEGTTPPPSTLHAFDLRTGAPKDKWKLPTPGSLCNDIAVSSDGTVYVSETRNMQILRLKPGAKALEIWVDDGSLGSKDAVLDGIAVVQGCVIVNTLGTSKLFSVPIAADGKPGAVTEVKLDRPLKSPDGHRSLGNNAILMADAGEGGRVVRVELSGNPFNTGKVTTLEKDLTDGPVSVTVVGDTVYVLEAQFAAMRAKQPTKPFKAKAVKLTSTSLNACPARGVVGVSMTPLEPRSVLDED
jgi:hypothetical protein